MTVIPQNKSEWEALNEVHRIASSLSQFLQDKYPRLVPTVVNIPEPNLRPLNLEIPHDILSPISTLSIPESVREEILLSCHRRIDEMQQKYIATYRQTCLSQLQNSYFKENMTAIQEAYQGHYRRHSLTMIQSWVSLIVAKVAEYQNPVSVKVKKSFNNDYTPALEKYFQFNGYPSVAHRSILASHSGMAPRQIEVWFQNHRNRAKKENRLVPRLNSDLPLKQALAVVQPDCLLQSRLPTPPAEKPITDTPEEGINAQPLRLPQSSQSLLPKSPSLLDDSYDHRPPHAYPSKSHMPYPDPFPNDNGRFTFPAPTWRRKPASVLKVSMAVDMDEFANTFHLKLNFSETSRRRSPTPSDHAFTFNPWFASTTTFVAPAPHPALIRLPSAGGMTSLSQASPIDTCIPEPIFGSSSLPIYSSPFPKHPEEGSPRKTRPLPRRMPPHSKSQSFSSRTSSFSSDTSSYCPSSPELSTPPPLPSVELPVTNLPGFPDDDPYNILHFPRKERNNTFPSSTFLVQDSCLSSTYPPSNNFPNVPFLNHTLPDFSHHLGELFF